MMNAYDSYGLDGLYQLSSLVNEAAAGDILRSNYTVLRSGALSRDGDQILARSSVCCLCGIRPSSELDHFLPKEHFPEFAALSVNLVPACGICNKRKGEGWRASEGVPAYLHAYLDSLPTTKRFLRAKLSITDDSIVISFRIKRTKGMPRSTVDLVRSQFEYFELGTAYAENATELIAEKLGSIEEYYAEDGAASVRKYLDRDARSATRPYGMNHWKPAVLRAAANSSEFCNGGFRLPMINL
ncbi:HNH endonuclease [Leifsonia sp. Root1293]|nr:hypothetical protein [Leifsonia sp. Root1293]